MLKKILVSFAIVGGIALINSCGSEKSYNLSKLQEEVGSKLFPLKGEEETKLKNIIRALYPEEWKIVGLFGVKQSEENFFKKYLVAVYNPYQHVVFYRFIWLTEDGKYLSTTLYRIGNNTVELILPKKDKEYPLENLRWLLDVERIVLSANLPQTLLKGKKYIYLVWNPYCESCYNRWRDIIKEATQMGLGIKIIPYHNIYYPLDNLYMLIYLLYRAQSEGLYTVLNNYYSAPSFEAFLNQLKKDMYVHLKDIPKERFNSIGFALQQINKVLKQAKILVVPTTVQVENIDPTAGLASGYVYVGRIELKLKK